MSNNKWEILAEVFGELEAELLRGLLEAGGIEVFLNQEGAARAYAVNVGLLGKVQVMVPSRQMQLARQILEDYETGKYISSDLDNPEEDSEAGPE